MPESVTDRLNCRYELLFLLVKSRQYWFDLDSIRIPPATGPAQTQRPGGMVLDPFCATGRRFR